MGREVKRVPVGFDWPVGKTWWGYVIDVSVNCQTCKCTGTVPFNPGGSFPLQRRDDAGNVIGWWCPNCDGDGRATPRFEVPEGPAFQMWETTSEGSPISPAFETPEELARWLADNRASAFGRSTATYEQWLAMIHEGWAPSAVCDAKGFRSGVEAAS